MRNMLLESRGKMTLVIKYHKAWLNCVLLFTKQNNSNNKNMLAEAISKKSAEGIAWYLLVAYSKIREERSILKKELLSRNKPIFSDLEDFWPIQIANEAKISKLTAGEAFAEDRVMGFPGQPLLERLGVWLMDILNDLSRSQCKSYQWKICGGSSCLMA